MNFRYILVILFFSFLSAQFSNLSIIGGISSNSAFVDSDENMYDNGIDFSRNSNYWIGVEKEYSSLIFGMSYLSRGLNFKNTYYGPYSQEEYSFVINYLGSYWLFPNRINEKLSFLGGIEAGIFWGGEVEYMGDTEDIGLDDWVDDADGNLVDFGALIGLSYKINSRLGVRVTYYYGLAEIFDNDLSPFERWNSTSFSLSYLLY